MVARTTRTLEGQCDVQSGPLPATRPRVVNCHHSRPGGRILLSAGRSRAVLLPQGQRLPAPGARARGGRPWYLTFMVLSIGTLIVSVSGPGRGQEGGREGAMRRPGSGRPGAGHRLDQLASGLHVAHGGISHASSSGQGAHTTHTSGPLLKHELLCRGGAPVRVRPPLFGCCGAGPTTVLTVSAAAHDGTAALGTRAAPPRCKVVIVPTGQGAEARGFRLGQTDTGAVALGAVLTRALLVRRLGLPARGTRPGGGPAGNSAREMRRREALDGPTPGAGQVARPAALPSPPRVPTCGTATPRLVGRDLPLRQINQRAADWARALLPTFDTGVNSPPAAMMALRAEFLPKPRWGPVANLTPALLAPQDLALTGPGAAARIVAPCFPTLWMMLVLVRLRFRDRDRHPRKQALVSPSTGGSDPPLCVAYTRGGHQLRQRRGKVALPVRLSRPRQALYGEGLAAILARPRAGRRMARVAAKDLVVARPRELSMALRAALLHSPPPCRSKITSYFDDSIAGMVG